MEEVVESESGVVFRPWTARSCRVSRVDDSRKDEGVRGVIVVVGGERTAEISLEPRRGGTPSDDGGDSIMGQRDLSFGRGRP